MYQELNDGEIEARASDDERQIELAAERDLERLQYQRKQAIEELNYCKNRLQTMSRAAFVAHDNEVLEDRSEIVDELAFRIAALQTELKQIGEEIHNLKDFLRETA